MTKADISVCQYCGERFRRDCFIPHFKQANEPRPQSKSNCFDTHWLRFNGYKQSKTGYWEPK